MDPSALIFVALAVAWAVYLIPKALEHHEESARSRTVDRFSRTMRVLARREPVSRRNARLVAASGAPRLDAKRCRAPQEQPRRHSTRRHALTPAQLRAHRRAAAAPPAGCAWSL